MKALLVVLTHPSSAEREDEYNTWYDDVHLGEVCQIPGITGAKRYSLSPVQLDPPSSLGDDGYLALYEIETDDVAQVAKELTARSIDGRFRMSDALRSDPPPTAVLFEAR
jgi:hypothetical protein